MNRVKDVLRMVVPSATVFFSSGCIMILELVASRLVARDLGSSLYTWTAIIGVVLSGIAVGNYLGGRIADRYHLRRALAVLFGLASGACVAVLVLNRLVGGWMWLWRLSWPTHVFVHVSLVFLLPSTLLGTIAPVVAKMALDKGLAAGRTIGDIYAWGAAGSIVGTFLAGFFLISTLGSTTIIWAIGAAMLVMAVLYWISCWAMYLWAMIFAALATMGMAPADWARGAGEAALLREPADPNVLYQDETPYCYVAVRQTSKRPDRRAFMQDKLKHSEIIMEDVTSLQYFYTRIYAGLTQGLIASKRNPRMMVIGGGGYAFPRYLKTRWPDSAVEVVEIDPGVTRAAMEAFGLERDTPIRTVNMDARNYVDQLLRRPGAGGAAVQYDFIYEDAINDYSVPFQLVTKEFNDKISRLLADDGVYVVNLIDTYDSGRFLGAVVGTLEETFPHVYVVTSRGDLPSLRDTFVVVAAKRSIEVESILTGYNKHLKFWLLDETDMGRLRDKAGGFVLTDDYAPVENMLAPVVRQSAREILAHKVLDKARLLQEQGNGGLREARSLLLAGRREESVAGRRQGFASYERSVEQYERAMELNPSMSIKACNEIGMMRVEQEKPEEAMEAFRRAIAYHRTAGTEETAIASVYMNLGILLRRTGSVREGNGQLAEAIRWFRIELEENPNSVVAWERLGDALAITDDMKGASEAFSRAVTLEPGNLSHYEKLAKALERQTRYSEAIDVVRRQIKLLQDLGQRDLASQRRQYLELLEYRRAKQPQ
jgi:predicted membrane-bound spermidine synthase/tetratricopeptide (TPR) repeat protein